MPDEELDEILRKGESKLGVEYDADCRASIIRYSDGFPYYTHLHALHSVRRALKAGEDRVGMNHFLDAMTSILDGAALSLRQATTTPPRRPEPCEHARASCKRLRVWRSRRSPSGRSRRRFWKIHPNYENLKQLDFISPHLNDLVEKYEILQSRGIPRSADRTYRFANPLMRVFVRLRAEQEKQSELPFKASTDADGASLSAQAERKPKPQSQLSLDA